jgi:iron complex outermembrane receptor protein
MTRKSHLLSLACLINVLNAEDHSQNLAPMVVQGKKEPATLTVPSAAASRDELAKTPGGTEVVEAERYLTGRSSTLADTFFLSPGVVAQPRFGSDEARLSIRGSGLQRTFHGRGVRVLQDGIAINLADGGFDMQSLEPTAAEYINVWRGGNALAYGSSTLGGAIDYISYTGESAPGIQARSEIGSWDYQRFTLAGGFGEGSRDLFSTFTYQAQDGFRDHAEQENFRLFNNFGWQISDHLETRFYLSAIQSNSALPGSLTRAQMHDDPRQANPSNILRDQRRDYELLRIANKTTLRSGANTFEMTSAFTYKDLDHPIFQVIDQLSNDYMWGGNVTNESELFGRENRLKAGLLLSYGETNAAQFQYSSPSSSQRGAMLQDDRQDASNIEVYVEDQYELGKGFVTILGASAARNHRENKRVFGTVNPSTNYDLEYDQIAPKAGLRWDRQNVQFFANVSGSYEPPSFSEAITSNVARDAQTGMTAEIGTRGRKGSVRWDLALYHSQINDELLAILDPITNLSTTTNAEETSHAGAELGAEIDLLGNDWNTESENRLVLHGAWTYGRFQFEKHQTAAYDYAGNTIAGLPPHLVRAELLWKNADGYYAGPTCEWVPQGGFIDHRNTLKSDPYHLIGFKVGRRVEDGISWFVEARNLDDEVFAATTGVIDNAGGADAAQFLPGDGLGVFAGIDFKW